MYKYALQMINTNNIIQWKSNFCYLLLKYLSDIIWNKPSSMTNTKGKHYKLFYNEQEI